MLRAIDPVEHLSNRLHEVKRVSTLSREWAVVSEAQRRTNSHKRRRETKRRGGGDPLDRWLRKRLHVEASSNNQGIKRSESASVDPAYFLTSLRDGHALYDNKVEVWLESTFISDQDMTRLFEQIFDPEFLPLQTEASGLVHILYSFQGFPSKPICPVRIIRVQSSLLIGVHVVCVEVVQKVLQDALEYAQTSASFVLSRNSSFVLVGCKDAQDLLQTYSKVANLQAQHGQTDPGKISVCPFTQKYLSKDSVATYVFGQEFGTVLGRNTASIAGTSLRDTNKTSADELIHPTFYTFMLGRKKQQGVRAILIIVPQEHAFEVWKDLFKICRRVIGSREMEMLYSFTNRPCFPRDYPDAVQYRGYWNDSFSRRFEMKRVRPASKKGKKDENCATIDSLWNLVDDINVNRNVLSVVRGWHYLRSFFEEDFETDQVQIDNLIIQVSVKSGRSQKLGRFESLDFIVLPTVDDYLAFCGGHNIKSLPVSGRRIIGLISSSLATSDGVIGIGHVTAKGFVRLLTACREENRKQRRRRMFVLVKSRTSDSVSAAFISCLP